ncbi:hypothetical protein RvY_17157 [Ramazzottius varieornatus]|uniref:Uncharacterized protein n=1 Tax=Ramazzottius varieornatus TaxID=947166 RepID=A0A1D1W771_RAMVA|nr:hypothetical protein RvY_17157 [Ramazzottius varieornatus]
MTASECPSYKELKQITYRCLGADEGLGTCSCPEKYVADSYKVFCNCDNSNGYYEDKRALKNAPDKCKSPEYVNPAAPLLSSSSSLHGAVGMFWSDVQIIRRIKFSELNGTGCGAECGHGYGNH